MFLFFELINDFELSLERLETNGYNQSVIARIGKMDINSTREAAIYDKTAVCFVNTQIRLLRRIHYCYR